MNWLNFFGFIVLMFSPVTYLCANSERENTICQQNALSTWPEEAVEKFNHRVLYLLDKKNNVFLFRGNLPENDHHFDLNNLTKSIRNALTKERISINDFKIMDLSFLNYITEYKQIEIEKEWFEKHPEMGSFHLYSLYGTFVDPLHLSEPVRNFTLRHYDIDGLKHLMDHLGHLMNQERSDHLIIYMHCMSGKDRTGEASACYLMQYKGFSYKEAIDLDRTIAKRDLKHLSVHAIRWYAFYLRDIKHCAWIGQID